MADISKIRVDEVDYDLKDAIARGLIGNLDSLGTTEKSDLVAALNELVAQIQSLSGITYVESTDTSNLVSIRDMESGTYVFYGKFKPYAASTSTLTFSSKLLVNLVKRTADTQVMVFYPVNNCVQYLKVTDDTYERKNIYLNDLMAAVDTLETDLGDLTALATTDQSNLVNAVNEVAESARKNYVTPQMFGAVGDGITDDTDAIMAARAAAIAEKKALYFPAGTYMIHAPIEMWSDCEIYGDGNKTVIKKIAAVSEILKPSGTKGSFVAGQNTFTVADGSKYKVGYSCFAGLSWENWDYGVHGVIESINGNTITVKSYPKRLASGSLETGLSSVELAYDNYRTVNFVFSTSFPVFCVHRYTTSGEPNPIHDVYIHDLTIDGDRQDDEARPYLLSLIYFDFQDNEVTTDSYTARREATNPHENIRLENLNLYNSPADGISIQSGKNIYVSNCITKNCTYNGVHFGVGTVVASVVGCKLNADFCGYFDCAGVAAATISNNNFDFCSTGIGGLDHATRGATISGNTFRGCGLGIQAGNILNPQRMRDELASLKYMNSKNTRTGITICNNTFYGDDLTGVGISFTRGEFFVASGNTFRELETAIKMGSTSNVRVSDNIIKDCVTVLSMISGDDTTAPLTYNSAFVGNVINAEADGTSAAVTIANAENMLVTGNTVTGASAAITNEDTASGVVLENNIIVAT